MCSSLFLEGLLSFFSPCVLPLVPLYLSYLTKDARREDGTYDRRRTLVLTVGFVLGICTVFFLAGLSSSALHVFFTAHTYAFELAGGILLVFLGLMGLHVVEVPLLNRTWMKQMDVKAPMSFVRAALLGFLFSFAWSPCVGPMLAQAILLAAQSQEGWLYIISYALGFVCIFLLLGFFTGTVLNGLKKYRGVVRYTGIISAVVILVMGGYLLTQAHATFQVLTAQPEAETVLGEEDPYDFTLKKADGTKVTLSDYKGKPVVVNFFGTWCYYCNEELPYLQQLHETRDDIAILLVAAPHVNGEGSMEEVEAYMQDKGYTMDIVYDTSLQVTSLYKVSGYPTTYFVKADGEFLGYVPGYVAEEDFESILPQLFE